MGTPDAHTFGVTHFQAMFFSTPVQLPGEPLYRTESRTTVGAAPKPGVCAERQNTIYPVTSTELEMLRSLPWWSRRKLIDRIISESKAKP